MAHADSLAPKPKRRWLQVSLRTFLVLITLFGIGLGWLEVHIRSARRQQAAVAAIRKTGGVWYDYKYSADKIYTYSQVSRVPPWLLNRCGEDFFHNVAAIILEDSPFDVFSRLDAFPRLRWLHVREKRDGSRFHTQPYPSDEDMKHLGASRFLEQVDVIGLDGITDEGIKQIAQAPNLSAVHILSLNSRLTDESLRTLARLNQLEELYLSGDFTDDGLASLQRHPRLKWVVLVSPRISDAGLCHIASLTELELLELQGCRVTNEGLKQLAGLGKLRYLTIGGTLVDAAMLQQTFPSCTIEVQSDVKEWLAQF
jgi:hypothetical protein